MSDQRLLSVMTGEGGGSHLQLWADAVLYSPAVQYGRSYDFAPRITEPGRIFAMSIVGPEQAVRAVQSGCAQEKIYDRPILRFRGHTGHEIKGRWAGGWNCRAHHLTDGAMHMVAIPKVTVAREIVGEEVEHLIIPENDLARAVYERLMLAFSTPILPLSLPGQPTFEREASYEWCAVVTAAILEDEMYWKPLRIHPDQPDQTWTDAGILRMTDKTLDRLISALIKARRLTIPEAA